MPPKVKITKNEIIQKAIELLKVSGDGAINARAIANALNCSTQPIFSNFATMDELHEAVVIGGYDIYLEFLKREAESGKYPRYKAFGMAYIRFAKEEKELFKFLFMRDRKGQGFIPTEDFSASVEMIMNANKVTKEIAQLMHLEMWAFVHGIGAMLATSFMELDWEVISMMITDVYQGLQAKHVKKEK